MTLTRVADSDTLDLGSKHALKSHNAHANQRGPTPSQKLCIMLELIIEFMTPISITVGSETPKTDPGARRRKMMTDQDTPVGRNPSSTAFPGQK